MPPVPLPLVRIRPASGIAQRTGDRTTTARYRLQIAHFRQDNGARFRL